MKDYTQILIEKFKNKSARIAILGLGYVGLPLAVVFAESGFKVIGIDPIKSKVDTLNNKKSYIFDISDKRIADLVDNGLLSATTDFSVLTEVDAISICVPTPLRKTGDPDLSFILSVADTLQKFIHPGLAIVLESTTYPGTTRELILQRLCEQSGLNVGEDFFLAFSPERVDPGREDWTTINTPKVIGGITENCLAVTKTWYEQSLNQVVPVSSAEVAEMTKLLENTFRMINIGMVNEMAIMCDRLGVDVWEVIDAAATKPFGFMKFQPGPGLGGHCIPIDPFYLTWKAKEMGINTRFIELAGEINSAMPSYVVSKVTDALNTVGKSISGSKILILGLAYKKNIDDLRESPSLELIELLLEKGAHVDYSDPFIAETHKTRKNDFNMKSISINKESLNSFNLAILATDHDDFDYKLIEKESKLIVDTRGKFKVSNSVIKA